jgi:formate hydrogenlyase transcriptional activator
MEDFYKSFALVSCGVSLAMGSVYIYLGSLRRSSTYFLFGIMGISLFVFYILPPVGFILVDNPPYDSGLIFKRVFSFAYYGIAPWFILAYSGYPKKWPAYLLSIVAVVCYVIMSFTPAVESKPLWSKLALVNFGGILLLGLAGARWLQLRAQRAAAWSLYLVMIAYGILFIFGAINQLTENQLTALFGMKLFFPIHFHSLIFMLVMGQQLVLDLFEKFKLEQHLHQAEARWKSFMTNAPLLTVELDREGKILFINDFGAKLLGYQCSTDLLDLNWFDVFVPSAERQSRKYQFLQIIDSSISESPASKAITTTRHGEQLVLSWSTFPIANADGKVQNVMSIGKNITDEEKASKLVEQLKHELLKDQLTPSTDLQSNDSDIIGNSQALAYALQKAKQVATTHAPVLLEGETGVGKELFANLIHSSSSRSEKPFVKVNCGALPKELIEDELFGHEKGAFTSAIQVRKGRFELADGGTLFLDEIGELPLDMQPKLLRVLQSGEFERIGGQKTIKVDVRVLAATNRNLSAEVQGNQFRSDLYYRLNVFPITIPALRKRKEDLPTLIQYFIARISARYSKSFEQVSHAGMQRLLNYEWPGNIRELKNVIERSVIISEGTTLRFDWWDATSPDEAPASDHSMERIERDHILTVMERCAWKINGENGAAEILNMNPNTLRSKMKRLGIKRPATSEPPSTI